MLINAKVLNIPPFISVHWNQIEFLTTDNNLLIIHLKSGKIVEIPDLEFEIVNRVFSAHADYLEIDKSVKIPAIPPLPHQNALFGSNDVKIAFSAMDSNGLGLPLQHMEELREAPNIPVELLEKVRSISMLVSPSDLENSPKPVENCNCPFCQISSAIHSVHTVKEAEETASPADAAVNEEVVTEDDLKFEEWVISAKGDRLYEVQNKLDHHESYNVFLGNPVGCTCGKTGCEHILAVLKS